MQTRLFIIITVDVEDPLSIKTIHKGVVDEEKSLIYGKVNGQYFGFRKIMEICDLFTIKATFFMDVFEYKRYGAKTFEDISHEIRGKRHDIQLHIHPQGSPL